MKLSLSGDQITEITELSINLFKLNRFRMVFLLSDRNVLPYLVEQKIIQPEEQAESRIELKACKNFNLLIHCFGRSPILIKQEPHDQNGKTHQDFLNEWQVYRLLQQYPELSCIQPLFPEAIHFNAKHAILAFNYLLPYCDLDDFYRGKQHFPEAIAAALGAALAAVHRSTFDRQDYCRFLSAEFSVPDLSSELETITPEIFGRISADGLKFYELFQRYDSLAQAIRDLNAAYEPCCLIHNDLKLGNILLHQQWEALLSCGDRFDSFFNSGAGKDCPIRLIDWEKAIWGDPASDLGTLVASYLKIWLRSLTVRAGIDLELALRLAPVRLEAIQPAIIALIRAYLLHFPEVLERWPNFLPRVMQFTGYALIESLQTNLHYYESFGNIEICMLQIAKTLLCSPADSIPTLLGISSLNPGSDSQLSSKPSVSAFSTPKPTSKGIEPTSQCDRADTVRGNFCDSDEKLDNAFNPESKTRFSSESNCEFNLKITLQDLVEKIQIQADFCIHHPHYVPSEPPAGHRLAHLPVELQRQYLTTQLQNYLYNIYFTGEQERGVNRSDRSILENNTLQGLNLAFYEQLHISNQGQGYFDPGWQVLRQQPNGTIAVQKERLTVHIDPERHLPVEHQSPSPGNIVAIHLPHHRIEAEFYGAIGNAGLVPDSAPAIELYFNVTPEGAIGLMQKLTQHLNAIHMPFLFRVLADPAEYGRYDAAILQVERCQYGRVWQLVQPIYETAPHYFHAQTPLLTKALAPGIGCAEEPEDGSGEFGISRFRQVAAALLQAWERQDSSPQGRISAIRQQFEQQGIDWQRPYLNPNAQDIYMPLTIPAVEFGEKADEISVNLTA